MSAPLPAGERNAVISMSAADGRLSLVLAAVLESIAAGRLAVFDYLDDAGLSEAAANKLDVAFEEAVANIVRHGARGEASPFFVVEVEDAGDQVRIAFEDDGEPFDPTAHVAAPQGKTLDDVRIGGEGVKLMRSFAASMRYELRRGAAAPFPGARPRNRLMLSFSKA